jgi:hypothetical protein
VVSGLDLNELDIWSGYEMFVADIFSTAAAVA